MTFRNVLISFAFVGILVVIASAAWKLSIVEHTATGKAERTFTVDCDFSKFRQIMVRKNATEAIVSAGGMKLLDESVTDLSVDTTKDDHPLLNAIRGKSRTELEAQKQITVELNDPNIDAHELHLVQNADVDETSLFVKTESSAPASQLREYRTTLQASGESDVTKIVVSLEMQVDVKVPTLFASRADAQVQKSAEDAVAEQAKSIKTFVAEYADKDLILPDLAL